MSSMTTAHCTARACALTGFLAIAGCGGDDDSPVAAAQPVTITPAGPNAVSYWNEIVTATTNLPAATGGTPEEARPNYAVDLATVHIAIYVGKHGEDS
jgi:hypothetical protein